MKTVHKLVTHKYTVTRRYFVEVPPNMSDRDVIEACRVRIIGHEPPHSTEETLQSVDVYYTDSCSGMPAHPIRAMSVSDRRLLKLYQDWCGETVAPFTQKAYEVVDTLRFLLRYETKTQAVNFLLDDGWSSSIAGAKRLVNALWKTK